MSILRFKRVVCGISGGVDSAVAALLLKQKGFEVVGLFMRNWDGREEVGSCQSIEQELEDARSICRHINIPLLEVNFVKEYWNSVFSVLLTDYENGLTPNPDVLCNRFVKFGSFYDYAKINLSADAIATGHYANSSFGNFLENYKDDRKAALKRAIDFTKDQTFFLSGMQENALRNTMFPLGNLFKFQVRQIARDKGLQHVSKKPDSTGICFIGDRQFSNFISEYIPDKPGLFVDLDTNKIIGKHKGIHHWTIGQRCRIGGLKSAHYVVHLDINTQIISVVSSRDHPALYHNEILTQAPHWISECPKFSSTNPYHCMFKYQHTEWTIPCQIQPTSNNQLIIHLGIISRAVTPGQYAVFYKNEICLGSAKILTVRRNDVAIGKQAAMGA